MHYCLCENGEFDESRILSIYFILSNYHAVCSLFNLLPSSVS